jgi:hypothetical protein
VKGKTVNWVSRGSIYKIIILPYVLYGCETWSLTLREEHRMRVIRRTFGPKREYGEDYIMRSFAVQIR